eukprot:tig00000194_g14828.t1
MSDSHGLVGLLEGASAQAIAGAVAAVMVVTLLLVFFSRKPATPEPTPEPEPAAPAAPAKLQPAKKEARAPKKEEKIESLAATLKGHTDEVVGFSWSPDGSTLATASSDRFLRLYSVGGVAADAKAEVKMTRQALDLDQPTCVAFNTDGRSVAVAYGVKKKVASYGVSDAVIGKQTAEFSCESKIEASQMFHRRVGDASYFITLAVDEVSIYGGAGGLLERFKINSMEVYGLASSACGRFFAAATWSSDCFVHLVGLGKGAYQSSKKHVMSLRGHKGGIYAVCFSADGRRAVTCSKDKTWRLWNIAVRYEVGEDPRLLLASPLVEAARRCALSADGSLVALGTGTGLQVFAIAEQGTAAEARLVASVPRAHDGEIVSMDFSPPALQPPLLATAGLDKRVRLWRF